MTAIPSLARALPTVAAAGALGAVVGFLRGGSVGAGLALGFAVAVGAAFGVVGFEAVRHFGGSLR